VPESRGDGARVQTGFGPISLFASGARGRACKTPRRGLRAKPGGIGCCLTSSATPVDQLQRVAGEGTSGRFFRFAGRVPALSQASGDLTAARQSWVRAKGAGAGRRGLSAVAGISHGRKLEADIALANNEGGAGLPTDIRPGRPSFARQARAVFGICADV